MKLFSVTKEHLHITECFLHTFRIAWIRTLTALYPMPGSLWDSSGFLDLPPGGEGAQQGKARPAGQQGGSRAPGQQSRWGQHWRERGKEAWMLNTVEGRKERDEEVSYRCSHNEARSWNPLLWRQEIFLTLLWRDGVCIQLRVKCQLSQPGDCFADQKRSFKLNLTWVWIHSPSGDLKH